MSVHGRPLKGFTLIEILVVVVILGIAAAIIVPQLGTRADLTVSAAARTLTGDLLYAQSRAIATQKMHYVQFDTTAMTYSVMDAANPNHLIAQPVLGSAYQVVLNSGAFTGVQIGSASFDGQATLAFDEVGTPYSYSTSTNTATALAAGSVVLKCGNQQLTVSVLPYSGEIKVQ